MKLRTPTDPGTAVSTDRAQERLTEFAELEPNWDTYGGAAPTLAALDTARALIEAIAEQYGPEFGDRSLPFDLAPVATGGIGLEWRAGDAALEVWIGPDGDLGYLLVTGQGPMRHFDEADNVTREDVIRRLRDLLVQ